MSGMRSPAGNENGNGKDPLPYRLIRGTVRLVSPKYTLHGTENLPPEPCVIVGNHCQMYGPVAAELYMPRARYTWCIGEMMNRKEVPAYAFRDFWSMKPRRTHWFYHLLSRVIALPAEYVFTHAHTIAVYHDQRVMTTFRQSVRRLSEGADIVIFPEKNEPYNAILCRFQEHFADLARLYYRRTGSTPAFVPMYVAPKLKSIHFGRPVYYRPESSDEEERTRICRAMAESITDIAVSLPPHTVVPYPNIPKKQYPKNTDCAADGQPEEKRTETEKAKT